MLFLSFSSCVHSDLPVFWVVMDDLSYHQLRHLGTVQIVKGSHWNGSDCGPFTLLHENRRWTSFTVGEPREKRHLSGTVLSKELLKQEIQWPKTSATQRTVLLLWHTGDAVSKVPLTAMTRALDSLCGFCTLRSPVLLFFLFCSTYPDTWGVPVKNDSFLKNAICGCLTQQLKTAH